MSRISHISVIITFQRFIFFMLVNLAYLYVKVGYEGIIHKDNSEGSFIFNLHQLKSGGMYRVQI